MRLLRRLWERMRGAPRGGIVPAWQVPLGQLPAVTFEELAKIYLKDPTARAAIDFLTDEAVGAGFYTTSEVPRAKDVIDDFCEAVDLDNKLQVIGREVVGLGNSFVRKDPKPDVIDELTILPITSVEKILGNAQGKPLRLKQTMTYGGGEIDFKNIIHFCYSPVNREYFGSGLLRTVAERMALPDGEIRQSFIEMKGRMQAAMIDQFEKFSAPNEMWTIEGLSDEKLGDFQSALKNMPKKGARWASSLKGDIKLAVAERARSFDAYIENVMNEFYLALQTPLPKLFTTPGFTEASARAALEMHERRVRGLQRYIKRTVEKEIFEVILRQHNLNPANAKVRLNWGAPEVPELKIADMLKAFELGAIRTDEIRKNLIKAGWELWEPEKPPAAPAET